MSDVGCLICLLICPCRLETSLHVRPLSLHLEYISYARPPFSHLGDMDINCPIHWVPPLLVYASPSMESLNSNTQRLAFTLQTMRR